MNPIIYRILVYPLIVNFHKSTRLILRKKLCKHWNCYNQTKMKLIEKELTRVYIENNCTCCIIYYPFFFFFFFQIVLLYNSNCLDRRHVVSCVWTTHDIVWQVERYAFIHRYLRTRLPLFAPVFLNACHNATNLSNSTCREGIFRIRFPGNKRDNFSIINRSISIIIFEISWY